MRLDNMSVFSPCAAYRGVKLDWADDGCAASGVPREVGLSERRRPRGSVSDNGGGE